MADYSKLGYNSNLQRINAPITNRTPYISGYAFDMQYEVQAKRLKASRVELDGAVKTSGGDVGTADFSAGSVLNLSSLITFNIPHQGKVVFGNAFVAVYQGTVLSSANQIYPIRGSNVTVGRYTTQGWYDLHAWDGISAIWRGLLVDTSGTSTQIISFDADWSYLDYTAGTVI